MRPSTANFLPLLLLLLPALVASQEPDEEAFPQIYPEPDSNITDENFYNYLKINAYGDTDRDLNSTGYYLNTISPSPSTCEWQCVSPYGGLQGGLAECQLPPDFDLYSEWYEEVDNKTIYIKDEGLLGWFNERSCVCNDAGAMRAKVECLFDKCSAGNETQFIERGLAWLYFTCYNEGNTTLPAPAELFEDLCLVDEYPLGTAPTTVPAGFNDFFTGYQFATDWPQQTATVPPQRAEAGDIPPWPPACEATGAPNGTQSGGAPNGTESGGVPMQTDETGGAGKIGTGITGAIVTVGIMVAGLMVWL